MRTDRLEIGRPNVSFLAPTSYMIGPVTESMSNRRGPFIFSLRAIIVLVAVLYASTTVFTPKLDVGIATVYLFEPIFLLTILCLLVADKLKFNTNIERSYCAYIALTALTYLEGPLYTGHFDITPALLIVKYSLFIMMMQIARYVNSAVSDRILIKIIYSQVIFVVSAGLYVVYNMVVNPISLGDMIWDYSPLYRLVGFTGQAIGIQGFRSIGNTSVQMGIYIGFLVLICLSLYRHLRKSIYLFLTLVLFFSSLLTYSRSGLLVIIIGVLYFLIDNFKNKGTIKLFSGAIALLWLFSFYLAPIDLLTSFGSLGKVAETSGYEDGSAQMRIEYVMRAMNYIIEYPYVFFIGTGYGESYTYSLIGTPHLESLLFTTLFQSGIFVFAILLLHFYYLWEYAKRYSGKVQGDLNRAVLYGYKLYIPGLFVANIVGGNSLQTDFLAPLFYFMIGICIFRVHKPFKGGVS